MTIEDVEAAFEDDDNNWLDFSKVEIKRSQRPDVHAFLLLDELVPGKRDMISAARHDQIFLAVRIDELALVATVSIIHELCHCGVFYDAECQSLSMFA